VLAVRNLLSKNPCSSGLGEYQLEEYLTTAQGRLKLRIGSYTRKLLQQLAYALAMTELVPKEHQILLSCTKTKNSGISQLLCQSQKSYGQAEVHVLSGAHRQYQPIDYILACFHRWRI
jgi:hypothetical protein